MEKDFSKPSSSRYIKIKLPTQVEFAHEDGVLDTLEGKVAYQAYDALMTGIQGEHWPITRAKFELTYEPVPPTLMGEAGTYVKKRILVEAIQMEAPFEMAIHDGATILKGNPGDWVISSPDGSQWAVADSIFKKTYKLAN